MTVRYIDTVDVAKLLRKALKSTFPGIKFSVRSSRYSGGSSIHVSYTDGPLLKTVEAVANGFAGATFDGMTDCMNYHNDKVTHEDGSTETIHYGAGFVFVGREFSPEFMDLIEPSLEAFAGADAWALVSEMDKNCLRRIWAHLHDADGKRDEDDCVFPFPSHMWADVERARKQVETAKAAETEEGISLLEACKRLLLLVPSQWAGCDDPERCRCRGHETIRAARAAIAKATCA